MTAPVASGWSGCRWGLHPLESAALSRRTREADIPDREGGRCSWGKAAVVGVVSTGQGSGKPDEEYLPEFDLTLGLLRRLMAADRAKFLRCKGCESENREGPQVLRVLRFRLARGVPGMRLCQRVAIGIAAAVGTSSLPGLTSRRGQRAACPPSGGRRHQPGRAAQTAAPLQS
jgi:hypothetical protein